MYKYAYEYSYMYTTNDGLPVARTLKYPIPTRVLARTQLSVQVGLLQYGKYDTGPDVLTRGWQKYTGTVTVTSILV